MQPDVLGFKYPKVDLDKCIDCGLCEKVCAFNDRYDKSLNLEKPIAYGARHKDIKEVMRSQSGATFAVISDYVLEKGGVVYGAAFEEDLSVAHRRVSTKEERNALRGSKYVQSDLTGIFKNVKRDLENGRTVLFSGTPCQTAGLNSYVGIKLRHNLILADIICHGTPSPYVWREYLKYMEKKNGDKIVKANFRDKKFGWNTTVQTFTFQNKREISNTTFGMLFYQHVMNRSSCSVCHFANTTRPSDITMGDFWGWQKTIKETDNKGISLILVNTDKGKALFDSIKDRMDVVNVDMQNCLQPNLQRPSAESKRRAAFERDFVKYGFGYMRFMYGDLNPVFKVKSFLQKMLPKEAVRKMSKLKRQLSNKE